MECSYLTCMYEYFLFRVIISFYISATRRFSWLYLRFGLRETPGGRLYATVQGRDPANLCGAGTGRSNSREMACSRGRIVFRVAKARRQDHRELLLRNSLLLGARCCVHGSIFRQSHVIIMGVVVKFCNRSHHSSASAIARCLLNIAWYYTENVHRASSSEKLHSRIPSCVLLGIYSIAL